MGESTDVAVFDLTFVLVLVNEPKPRGDKRRFNSFISVGGVSTVTVLPNDDPSSTFVERAFELAMRLPVSACFTTPLFCPAIS